MTVFAAPDIVRCPCCERPVRRLRFASINLSEGLFPLAFQKLARGEVVCPRCGEAVDARYLTSIARLDGSSTLRMEFAVSRSPNYVVAGGGEFFQ